MQINYIEYLNTYYVYTMFHLLTVATHSENMHEILLESAKRYKHDIKVLGKNKSYTSHRQKDIWVYEAIQGMPANDIVCFCDGFDSLLGAGSDEIKKAFMKTNKKILVSVDGQQIRWERYPIWSYAYHKVYPTVDGHYINSGLYIGYVHALKEWLKKCIEYNASTKSNQRVWALLMHDVNMLDIQCDIFYNHMVLFSANNCVQIKNDQLYQRDKRILVVSFPGNRDATSLIQQLNYKQLPSKKKDWSVSKLIFYLPHFKLEFMFNIFLLLTNIKMLPIVILLVLIYERYGQAS